MGISYTRAAILAAATKLWSEQGYDKTGLREIADLVGIRQPSIYHHFPSKDAIMLAIVEPYLRALTAVVDDAVAGPPSPPRRRALMRGWVETQMDNRGAVDILTANTRLYDDVAAMIGLSESQQAGRVGNWLAEGKHDAATQLRVVNTVRVFNYDYIARVSFSDLPREKVIEALVDAGEALLAP